jgi:arylsulfatase A-like enzyme
LLPSSETAASGRAEPLARSILLLGCWAGLAGGLGEGLAVLVARYGFDRYVFRGPDILWMAPISLGILCLLAAIPLAFLAGWQRRTDRVVVSFFVLGYLALLNVTPDLPKVHPAARLILLAGLAAAVARGAARYQATVWRLIRVTVLPLLALVVLLAIGIRGARWLQERRALAALPRAAAGAPNVLLLILDTVRAVDLSLYGYGRQTSPVLDSLGAGGAVFDRAYAPSSWTLNSHAAMFTGHRPFATGVSWKIPLDTRLPTLAEALRARGYATAGFSANPYYVTRESGLARGFVHFDDHLITPTSVLFAASLTAAVSAPIRHALGWHRTPDRKTAAKLRTEVTGWLARQNGRQPFFVMVNSFDAHAPYLPPAPFDTAFTGRSTPWRDRNPELEAERAVTGTEAAGERDAYDQTLKGQDHQVGWLLRTLEARGLLRNTLLIVTSDHGEEFGEWGLLSHGNTLNPAVLWVPLVIAFPGRIAPGTRVAEPVSLVDLPATVLTLADSARASELPGLPLLQRGQAGPLPHSPAVAEMEYARDTPAWYQHGEGPLRSLTVAGWHYIRETRGQETLMDIRTVPAGTRVDPRSLAAQALLQAARARLDSAGPQGPGR